jgi:hypothetical protein
MRQVKRKQPVTCSVAGCILDSHAKGVCLGHYARQLRGADLSTPLKVLTPRGVVVPCSVQGCERRKRARGMCSPHYTEWHLKENPDRPFCSVTDCPKRAHSRGLCQGHYRRMMLGQTFDAPLAMVKPRGVVVTCRIDDCERPADALRMCGMHYRRFKLHGDPHATPGRSRGRAALCEIENCNARPDKSGLCDEHGAFSAAELVTLTRYIRRRLEASGYVYARPPVDHPLKHWRDQIAEHRLVMERMIGRPLLPNESPHHRNGVRHDNRESNLELWVKSQPSGQRAEDLVEWADQILALYGHMRKPSAA